MKLTPTTFFLGLGLSAAIASEEANLRANASTRQLSNSNQQASGGTWLFYLMLNTLAAPLDVVGLGCGDSACNGSSSGSRSRELWENDGYSTTTTSWMDDAHTSWMDDAHTSSSSHSSSDHTCPVRCHKAPHLKPPHLPKPKPKPKKHSGGSSSSSTTWADDAHTDYDENTWTNDGHTDDYSVSWRNDGNGDKAVTDDGANSGGGEDGGDAANGGNGDADTTIYSSYSANLSGGASQVNGANSVPVWLFFAAFAIGAVVGALMSNKREKARQGNQALKGSIKKRMELFPGGLHREVKHAAGNSLSAKSSLSENDYENERSFVEMSDHDES